MLYRSLRVAVTDWGITDAAEYFSPLGSAPSAATVRNHVHPHPPSA